MGVGFFTVSSGVIKLGIHGSMPHLYIERGVPPKYCTVVNCSPITIRLSFGNNIVMTTFHGTLEKLGK